tara:strand:- start:2708 stop:3148 length:441 start_codon:yes stop_codon:yes gene_type:complete
MATFNLDGSISKQRNIQDELKARSLGYGYTIERDIVNLRDYRDSLLSQSDWRVVVASESGIGISTDWKTYRQSLRDLPAHNRAPNKFMIADWPLSPDESQYPEGAIPYIAEITDPVGLGTTSWVGLTTTGDYYLQDIPEEKEEGEE